MPPDHPQLTHRLILVAEVCKQLRDIVWSFNWLNHGALNRSGVDQWALYTVDQASVCCAPQVHRLAHAAVHCSWKHPEELEFEGYVC
jgi:hypothetical protein